MVRRNRAVIDPLGTANLRYQNPAVVAWWSAAFPGLGHMLLDMHIKGNVLFLFEIIINVHAKLNLAMVYSFTGDFQQSAAVLNTRWVLIYIPFYFFCIWDSYRSAIKINQLTIMTKNQPIHLKVLELRSFEICFLDKRQPWIAAVWSMLIPGLGQLYARRLITSLALMSWALTIYINCNEFQSVLMLLDGVSSYQDALQVLKPEWLLFMPSLIFGSSYDAYSKTIDNNRLFEEEQRTYLESNWPAKKIGLSHRNGGL
ncbi:hypothetical protein ACFP7A_10155 [Sporolactobacillus kofuensis]|uniref:Uncharacterized protein n=1 Tax=Sporolactobacillus kofuensis TaxID=269672 RepID=A0ABW1WIL7_9BACL|nr:hypothetical protein [Sporolactobacillus kofuensis]MCO7176237.1 hypothetical protein [Sporolactobacillus kofuensis]